MTIPTPESREVAARRIGMLCVAVSAMLFASKGLFGKALYARGVGFELLVAVRALIAMPLFVWMALPRGPRAPAVGGDEEARPLPVDPAPATRPRPRAIVAAAIAGVTCYYVGALVDFWALTMIDASVERVLLFSYPAMVVLWHTVARRRAPEGRVVVAMAATYVGIFFAMGGVDLAELRANLFGAAIVLVAAVTTAIYFLIGEKYTRELGSTRFAAIAMSSSAVLLALHFAVFRSFDEIAALQAYDWLLLAILGIACMFVPGLLQAEGMKRVGAQRAAIGSTLGPPTTIVLAALFLGERLNGWQMLGTALIVVSVLVLSRK
jgi:drug/metabolite transporter (DMT)-like permease